MRKDFSHPFLEAKIDFGFSLVDSVANINPYSIDNSNLNFIIKDCLEATGINVSQVLQHQNGRRQVVIKNREEIHLAD